MDYNPYDLVQVNINGKQIDARPIAFDSEVANNQTMLNSIGNIVIPTRLSTICPDCGGGMIIDVPVEMLLMKSPESLKMLFASVEWPCKLCNPDAPPPDNPFMNPVHEERIGEHELDPLLHNPVEEIKKDETTVAERMEEEFFTPTRPDVEPDTLPGAEDLGEEEPVGVAHATSANLVSSEESYPLDGEYDTPEVGSQEAQEDVSEGSEEEETEEPDDPSEVEEEEEETPSEAEKTEKTEKTVELDLDEEIGQEEEIEEDEEDEDDLDDLIDE